MSAIHDFGRNRAGTKIDRGFYAIDPVGHLVLLPPSAPLKAGWRLATEGDIHAKQRAELARTGPALVAFDETPPVDPVRADDAIED